MGRIGDTHGRSAVLIVSCVGTIIGYILMDLGTLLVAWARLCLC